MRFARRSTKAAALTFAALVGQHAMTSAQDAAPAAPSAPTATVEATVTTPAAPAAPAVVAPPAPAVAAPPAPVAAPEPIPGPVVTSLEPTGTAPEPMEDEEEAEPDADDGPSLNVGLGIRTGLGLDTGSGSLSITDGFMGKGSIGGNEALVRPYFSGQLNKYLGFTANFEAYASNTDAGVPVRIMDAIVQLHLDDLFNVWVGQFLPPQDRAALDGPYYMNAWNYPIQVAGFPFDVAARDRGFAIWGQVGGGKFKYQLGAFDLQNNVEIADARFAGRLTLNLLDPEPGYYTSSTYYGEKDILAIGISGAAQPAKLGSGAAERDTSSYGFQADVLFEKNLQESGVITLEGSLWVFENGADGYVTNPGGTGEGQGADATYGSGTSFYVLASYLTPSEVGIGKLQPSVRLQFRDPESDSDPTMTFDVGLGYIIDGHNNKMYLGFQRIHPTADGAKGFNAVYLGSQIQL